DNAPQNSAPFVDQRPNGPGVSKIDPSDPAAPMYRLLAKMRSPVTLRDLMIHPVRPGYIGQEQPIAAAELPKSAAELYPDIDMGEVAVPSPAGRIRCQVFSPPASSAGGGARPMMLYLHGGGFTVGQSEDTAYITSRIAAENAMVVVSANYRLAPEWPFPHESFERLAPLGIVYDAAFIGFIRGAYLVHGKNWAHPHASPTRADLRNYPPTFIATGTADPLVDDN